METGFKQKKMTWESTVLNMNINKRAKIQKKVLNSHKEITMCEEETRYSLEKSLPGQGKVLT